MSEDQKTREASPDWVAELAGSRPEATLRDLAEVVEVDAARMNGLSEELLENCVFRFDWGRPGTSYFSVTRTSRDPHRLAAAMGFSTADQRIVVRPSGVDEGVGFDVHPEWCEKTGRRVLKVDGEPQKLWQISSPALRHLFFGYQLGVVMPSGPSRE